MGIVGTAVRAYKALLAGALEFDDAAMTARRGNGARCGRAGRMERARGRHGHTPPCAKPVRRGPGVNAAWAAERTCHRSCGKLLRSTAF